jgi:hypothetical protein
MTRINHTISRICDLATSRAADIRVMVRDANRGYLHSWLPVLSLHQGTGGPEPTERKRTPYLTAFLQAFRQGWSVTAQPSVQPAYVGAGGSVHGFMRGSSKPSMPAKRWSFLPKS